MAKGALPNQVSSQIVIDLHLLHCMPNADRLLQEILLLPSYSLHTSFDHEGAYIDDHMNNIVPITNYG
jgi:hypothetical protein